MNILNRKINKKFNLIRGVNTEVLRKNILSLFTLIMYISHVNESSVHDIQKKKSSCSSSSLTLHTLHSNDNGFPHYFLH